MIIDSHQHFWALDRGDYPWPNAEVAPIFRDFGPADLEPLISQLGRSQTVLVQATDTVAETDFLLSIADSTPFVAGVVGWLDLTDPAAPDTMDRWLQNPAFKGLRPMLQNIADTDWILQPVVMQNLSEMSKRGLRFDALILPRHLDAMAKVACELPDLPIVIDHCAKPIIANGADAGEDWRHGMAELATYSNVLCKISGLANEAGDEWTMAGLQPVVDHILTTFGPARTMWGSDWPVVNLVSDYAAWRAAADQLFSGLSATALADVNGGTAGRFYGLDERA
jgi:L-fuconolactonase